MDVDRPLLEIDLEVISNNYKTLCELTATRAIVAAAIKADCYGLGAKHVVPSLYAVGCRHFFVANIEEAIEVRSIISAECGFDNRGLLDRTYMDEHHMDEPCMSDPCANEYHVDMPYMDPPRIYVLNGVFASTVKSMLEHDIVPILNNLAQIQLWSEFATKIGKKLDAIIHIDSGMNRLGVRLDEFNSLVAANKLLPPLNVTMLISHLSSSDEPHNHSNPYQLDTFLQAVKLLHGCKRSIANSGGIFLGKEYHLEMVRPGAALYGLCTHPEAHKYIHNPVHLSAPIIQVQTLKVGESIGYNRTFVTKKEMMVATLPLGYADGFLRSQSSKAKMYIDGQEVNVVGRVSMDLVTIDVSNVPRDKLLLGAHVEVIGSHQTPDQLAISAGTVGYEIITSLGNRYKKVYNRRG